VAARVRRSEHGAPRSARRRGRQRGSALALAALAVVACGGPRTPDAPAPVAPSAQASLSAQVDATASLVRGALAPLGGSLVQAVEPYRPSEPPTFAAVPRGVFRADLVDPREGFVVVYELPDAAAAGARGRELADYLESGFGQTNYPLDAQFSLAQVGSTLVFTWWSRERADDEERARAYFDAVSSVGIPIPITK
jgi:hypothetical protein